MTFIQVEFEVEFYTSCEPAEDTDEGVEAFDYHRFGDFIQGYFKFKLLLVPRTKTVQAMSVGANDNTLRIVAEKLKQLTDDTQEQYEAFH